MELYGGELSENPLTGNCSEKPKRGRPREIEDEQLLQALREREHTLDQSWGAIGWTLSDADSITDVQLAFSKIEQFTYSWLDPYREPQTEPATLSSLQSLRKQREVYREQVSQSHAAFAKANDSIGRLNLALQAADGMVDQGRLRALQPELIERQREATDDLSASRERSTQIESALWRQEACFAQSQLLAFIRGGRFTINPLNLAMAMAGLPLLSARVSHDRCRTLKSQMTPGLEFIKFQAVESVFARPVKSVTEAVDDMRAHLFAPDKERSIAIKDLKYNWYFLRKAIETTWGESPQVPLQALPYRIFADYQRRVGIQSQVDVLLSIESRL